ncbi:MAG: addiction module protein [Alphaproteobacteria bacterium]|nr:addiction module protein [Alphaproteobacteria bacterium]
MTQALALPDEEREDLALKLVASLPVSADHETERAWARVVERRLGELLNGTARTRSAADVLRDARRG